MHNTSLETLNFDFTYSPDDTTISSFFEGLYSSPFYYDLLNPAKFNITRNYVMLHCSSCEEKGYTSYKEDCLSGGRYCMRSKRVTGLTGEVMLIQTIKNLCVEKLARNEPDKVAKYYWMTAASCVKEFRQVCMNAVLKELGLKDQVMACVKESFRAKNPASPNIILEENNMLRFEKQNFQKVEHFNAFPMLKINGVPYLGDLSYNQVMLYACQHVNERLNGCNTYKQIVVKEKPSVSSGFKYVVIGVLVGLVLGLVVYCRMILRKKFDSEMSHQIDKSIASFLERNGGSDI
jgi:hypothetical protein